MLALRADGFVDQSGIFGSLCSGRVKGNTLRISNFENGILGFSSCRVEVNTVWKTFVRESVREFVHKVSTGNP